MKKIPTAKEFIENYIEENNHDSNIDVEDALIEFAKLHVGAALEEASKKAHIQIDEHDLSCSVDKSSILNAYPPSNIE